MPAPFGILSPGEVGEQPTTGLDALVAGIINGTVQIPKHVIDAARNTAPPGLRREDYTDIPAPSGFVQAQQPGDEMRSTALNMALLSMGGAAPFGVPVRAGEAALGSGPIRTVAVNAPSLRPAVKYNERLYKGTIGDNHLALLPENIQQEIAKNGAENLLDAPGVTVGYVDHRGRFLDHTKAGAYALDNDLIPKEYIDYHGGGFIRNGGLTSSMLGRKGGT